MLKVRFLKSFEKDYKRIKKRGCDVAKLQHIIEMLRNCQPLPEKNNDHALSGNYIGYRECHIEPDWLLIYKIEKDILLLTLTRTGTHSDLFK